MSVLPEGFLWSGAGAAAQVEGVYLEDGKGSNVVDTQICYKKTAGGGNISYTRELLKQRVADVQAEKQQQYYPKYKTMDLYHRYREYIGWTKGCGFKALRMGVSWVRTFPGADDKYPSEAGLRLYDEAFDELCRQGIEPIVTPIYYDVPLKVITHYQEWYGRKMVDLYERLTQTCLKRYKDKVTYWIVINQINPIFGESFSSLGIVMDEYEDFTAAKYQAVYHESAASVGIVKVAREPDPALKVDMMLADQLTYAKTCDLQNVKIATEKSRMKDSFFADVQLRGEYLRHAKTWSKKRGITIQMEDGDEELIRSYTMDFLAVAYHYSHCVDENGNRCVNPYTKATEWGWAIDLVGLYNTMTQHWGRYGVPMMIAENGVGAEETLGSDGCIHDEYRIDYRKHHTQELKDVTEEGTDIFAYTMWSLFDIVSGSSCEMEKQYGFTYMDIDNEGNGTGKCIPKDSSYWYACLMKSNVENLQGAQRASM